ncbi:glycosyltransferase family 2 protein [Thermocrinis minervae]|uniref:Glycosyltransferase involved in cell wall bisynthesis n=1 Tax=Thermocrinis minervae TaxID=381751 RepID=A0A1M6RPA6_9AQUI|nr:glycosyltransferase family 2 protein [Thermocrinis minervae]SHK34283.1 Glycosyltransferase involved in cell wall bisynthesis [Thermocrinis minervae]
MLSVLIRTKNEEENIARAIKSVLDIADEVVVVDSGSTDRTVQIAKSLGAKVFFKEWEGYSQQLNYGLTLCQGPWILVLDADEEVSAELRDSIRKELKKPRYDAYYISRRTFYLGAFLKHAWYPEWRLRLFKKGTVKFEGALHERAIFNGRAGKLKGDIFHYSFKDLRYQYIKTLEYARIVAQELRKKGRKFRLYNLLLNPVWAFIKVYFLQLGFLDGIRGLSVAFSALVYVFLKYLFLWEMEHVERKDEGRT